MKKPILVCRNLSNLLLNALMLVESTASWSNWFHLFITRLEKNVFYCPACTWLLLIYIRYSIEYLMYVYSAWMGLYGLDILYIVYRICIVVRTAKWINCRHPVWILYVALETYTSISGIAVWCRNCEYWLPKQRSAFVSPAAVWSASFLG